MKMKQWSQISYTTLAVATLMTIHSVNGMDLEQPNQQPSRKRTFTEAGFIDPAENSPKRAHKIDKTDYTKLSTPLLLEKAYAGNAACRDMIFDKLYNGLIHDSLVINFSRLLPFENIDDVKSLTDIEMHLIFFWDIYCTALKDVPLLLNLLMTELKARVANNSLPARHTLGNIYCHIDKNYSEGLQHLTHAAECGYSHAQCKLGYMYMYSTGQGVTRDPTKAFEWCTKAAEQGLAKAQCNLVVAYATGQGVPQDFTKAFEWCTKAAEQGLAVAQFGLGTMYARGEGVTQDFTKTLKWYTKAAEQKHPQAQYNLGIMYTMGQGVAQDFTKARHWLAKAAEQKHPQAQYNLGIMYYKGEGVAQDFTKAFEWLTKAAGQGFSHAQDALGKMYAYGHGVAQDFTKAFEWLTKAAEQGHPQAQDALGKMYAYGHGVAQDFTKALEWYTKAAEQGHSQAQFSLGIMYEHGKGVTQDFTKALEWYTKAAEQGHPQAQDALGTIYNKGLGLPYPDYDTGIRWLVSAGKKNDPQAKKNLQHRFFVPSSQPTGDMGVLADEIQSDIQYLRFVVGRMIGVFGIEEQLNNPLSGCNTAGREGGLAISHLHEHFKRCTDFSMMALDILMHLSSSETLKEGFLVNNLELRGVHRDFIEFSEQLKKKETTFMHLCTNPTNKDMFLTLESAKGLELSKFISDVMNDNSSLNRNLKGSVNHLKIIYEVICGEKMEGTKIEDAETILDALHMISDVKEKLLEIVYNTTPLRNQAFKENKAFWGIFPMEE